MKAATPTDFELPTHAAAWPTELRLLLVYLRLALGTASDADREMLGQPMDWEAWLRWVERHRVGSFLHHRLPSEVRACLPEPVALRLRGLGLANAQRALARVGELIRIAAILQQRGIRSLGFKGALLSQQLYGEVSIRPAGDIDLLVSASDATSADAVLREAGYLRTYPDFELTALQWRKFLLVQHELNHFDARRGIMVELQWKLEGLPDLEFDELWRTRATLTQAGHSMATLPEVLGGIFLFVHGARHGWRRLFWLLDVAQLLRTEPTRVMALWQGAQQMRVVRPFLQGAALAHKLLGVELPAELVAVLGQRDDLNALVTEALRQLGNDRACRTGVGDILRDTAYQFRLQDNWRGRLSLMQPRLLSPLNWKLLPLPDRWFWLYYPAAPLLWIWRRSLGRKQASAALATAGGSPPPRNPRTP